MRSATGLGPSKLPKQLFNEGAHELFGDPDEDEAAAVPEG